MMLQEKDYEVMTYEVMTGKLKRLADAYCDGRMVSVLEGGYSLEFLKRCVARHVLEMMRK
jgi:acetoin utilization deacetylase AcuC-like enzyme